MGEQASRKFGANNGRVIGWVAIAMGAVLIALMLADTISDAGFTAIAVVALVMACVWILMIRPSVHQEGDNLVLRQPFTDISIPLAAIDYVNIRLFMVVSVGDRVFSSSAFGRSRRQVVLRDSGKARASDPSHADIVEENINNLADNARAEKLPTEPITRTPAWPEIVLLGVLAGAVLVSAFLR